MGIELHQLDENGVMPPDAVILDLSSLSQSEARLMIEECHDRRLPVVAAVPRDAVVDYDPSLNPDEMLFCPVSEAEWSARVGQAIDRVSGRAGPKLMKIGELSIDQERYKVKFSGRRLACT